MPRCRLGLQFLTKPCSFKRPWGSDSNLSRMVMSLWKEPLWYLQEQQTVLGNTTSLVKIMATAPNTQVEAEQPFRICFTEECTPQNYPPSTNSFLFCGKIVSLSSAQSGKFGLRHMQQLWDMLGIKHIQLAEPLSRESPGCISEWHAVT